MRQVKVTLGGLLSSCCVLARIDSHVKPQKVVHTDFWEPELWDLVFTDASKENLSRGKELTGDGVSVTSTLASCDEDNITLACIGVLVLEKEEFIDAIVIQGRDFDDNSNRTGEAAFDDNVFFAADLSTRRMSISCHIATEKQVRQPYLRLRVDKEGPYRPCLLRVRCRTPHEEPL